jgi:hypothetical protein
MQVGGWESSDMGRRYTASTTTRNSNRSPSSTRSPNPLLTTHLVVPEIPCSMTEPKGAETQRIATMWAAIREPR